MYFCQEPLAEYDYVVVGDLIQTCFQIFDDARSQSHSHRVPRSVQICIDTSRILMATHVTKITQVECNSVYRYMSLDGKSLAILFESTVTRAHKGEQDCRLRVSRHLSRNTFLPKPIRSTSLAPHTHSRIFELALVSRGVAGVFVSESRVSSPMSQPLIVLACTEVHFIAVANLHIDTLHDEYSHSKPKPDLGILRKVPRSVNVTLLYSTRGGMRCAIFSF